jgi:hypothetical protein
MASPNFKVAECMNPDLEEQAVVKSGWRNRRNFKNICGTLSPCFIYVFF